MHKAGVPRIEKIWTYFFESDDVKDGPVGADGK